MLMPMPRFALMKQQYGFGFCASALCALSFLMFGVCFSLYRLYRFHPFQLFQKE
jgi:hypothetical protein